MASSSDRPWRRLLTLLQMSLPALTVIVIQFPPALVMQQVRVQEVTVEVKIPDVIVAALQPRIRGALKVIRRPTRS